MLRLRERQSRAAVTKRQILRQLAVRQHSDAKLWSCPSLTTTTELEQAARSKYLASFLPQPIALSLDTPSLIRLSSHYPAELISHGS